MADEPVYLWNWYRTRKHISTGEVHGSQYRGNRQDQYTLCGQVHSPKETHIDWLRRGNPPSQVEHYASKMDSAPLCKHCERAAAKASV